MKLLQIQKQEIYQLYNNGEMSVTQLSQKFFVSKSTIYRVINKAKLQSPILVLPHNISAQTEIKTSNKLEVFDSIDDTRSFAELLRVSPVFLTRVLYFSPSQHKYTKFEISKKNGGIREIYAPNEELKKLQHNLANLLYKCLSQIRENQNSKQMTSFGFEKNKTIFDNAYQHKKVRNLLNIDLEDFFDSFNFGRVRGFFIKNQYFQLSEKVATIIAQIACFDNKLPQGSPCSPVITNLICNILDVRLRRLAVKNGCQYTRYADDITFSTNRTAFSQELLLSTKPVLVGKYLEAEIQRAGFKINDRKIHVSNNKIRQEVTGLIVNKKVNVPEDYHKRVRAMCNSLFSTGIFYIKNRDGIPEKGSLNQLEGFLSFIDNIDFRNNMLLIKQNIKTEEKNKRERLMSKFLFFKNFYGSDKATILTEGKTDIVYLKSAIEQRANAFSFLASVANKDTEYRSKVKFLEKNRRTKYFLGLNEGCGCFKKFIIDYKQRYDFFADKAKKKASHPVILVLDNDGAIQDIISVIKSVLKLKDPLDRKNMSWLNIVNNLYVVLVPYRNNKDTVIENCFSQSVLDTKIAGKSLYLGNDSFLDNQYGKNEFSKYIRSNAKNINFDGFDELLKHIQDCIRDYASQKEDS